MPPYGWPGSSLHVSSSTSPFHFTAGWRAESEDVLCHHFRYTTSSEKFKSFQMTPYIFCTVTLIQCRQEIRGRIASSFTPGINSRISRFLTGTLFCPLIPLLPPIVNHRPTKSSSWSFFCSICPFPPSFFPHSLSPSLLITLTLQYLFFFLFLQCFLIACLYCYITFVFAVCLNLAILQLLKSPPKHLSRPFGSICDCSHTLCPLCPSVSLVTPPALPPLPRGHAGAHVPSLSLPALPDLDHSGSGPLHPGSLHLVLVWGHAQGGQAPLPVACQNEELWSEQQRTVHHRYRRWDVAVTFTLCFFVVFVVFYYIHVLFLVK